MRPTREPLSLRYRLATWLAVQTFVGLGGIAVAVYWAIDYYVEGTQQARLSEHRQVITHLLEEGRQDGDEVSLRHKLDDFFAGPSAVSLRLISDTGEVRYRSPAMRAATEEIRFGEFAVVNDSLLGGLSRAEIALQIGPDRRLLNQLAMTLLASTLAGTAIVSAGGYFLSRVALRPVQRLTNEARELIADVANNRLDDGSQPRELVPMVKAFNALLDHRQQVNERIGGFSADVAHELNTPLANLIASAELILRKPANSGELAETLSSNLEEFHRLSGIVRDMLFLARADGDTGARRVPVPSLAALVADVVEYHEAQLTESGLRVRIVGDAQALADAQLIKRAVSNLLGNATRFATAGSEMRVEIVRISDSMLRLTVANQGQAIPSTVLPQLFDRFYRGDSARAQGDFHHGLGLAIVAAIARMHGGKPFAESSGGITQIGLILSPVGPYRPTEAVSSYCPDIRSG